MPRSKINIAVCQGCGSSFVPHDVRQVYHSKTCQKNNQQRVARKIRIAEADRIATASFNSYAATMRKLRPKGAIGYRLFCRELDLLLPVTNSARRNGENPRTRHFSLQPLELPVSPLIGEYGIYWVFADGSSNCSDPPTSIRVDWADECEDRKVLGPLLKQYRKARREQAARELQAYEAIHGLGLQANETHSRGLLLEPPQKSDEGDGNAKQ